MALNPQLSAAFQHIAGQINNYLDANSPWFTTTAHRDKLTFAIGERTYRFQKLGYSQLGNFRGIGYDVALLRIGTALPETQWSFWILNPTDVTATKRALIAGLHAAINDTNSGKLSWTIDAQSYV